MSKLEIKDLHCSVLDDDKKIKKEILKGVNLSVNSGEIHAIMGPNGSGKSTLAYCIAGHPNYLVTKGQITLDGEDVLKMKVDERAKAGIFLAMQYPTEVSGVSISNFLRVAKTAVSGERLKIQSWLKEVKDVSSTLKMDEHFLSRSLNEGFSGGEKKKSEILQMELLGPKFSILDETDSGLDVDALKVVSEGISRVKEKTNMGVLLVTHYSRILNYLKPDIVSVFVDGKVVAQGDSDFAFELEKTGYEQYV